MAEGHDPFDFSQYGGATAPGGSGLPPASAPTGRPTPAVHSTPAAHSAPTPISAPTPSRVAPSSGIGEPSSWTQATSVGDPWATVAPAGAAGSPPLRWLAAAAGSAALGLALVLLDLDLDLDLGHATWPALVGWGLTGPLAVGLLTTFTARDTHQRARPTYTSPAWLSRAYWATVALALVGLLVACWRLADWIGRR